MIVKKELSVNVVEAAKQRVIDIFEKSPKVYLSISGGKDSTCVNHVVYSLARQGKIDREKLTVVFIDEEAIYPDVEEHVRKMRKDWLKLGVQFDWYAMEFKHFNCFNNLTEDETFVCFDRYKKDSWVRQPPDFAIRSDPFLIPRKDNYQSWSDRKFKDGIRVIGLRTAESVQRLMVVSKQKKKSTKKYPIYDWRDDDVWLYIKNNNLDFPITYLYMYQVGVSKSHLRISQFFSIDTAPSLVKLNQYYPELMDRIIEREPNAYLAAYYYDSEMFRRSTRTRRKTEDEDKDNKKLVLDKLSNIEDNFPTKSQKKIAHKYKLYLAKNATILTDKVFKQMNDALEAGDPKERTLRGIMMTDRT